MKNITILLLVSTILLLVGCRAVYYSTSEAGLIYVAWGDSKLKGIDASVGSSALSVDSTESDGKLEVPVTVLDLIK